MKCPKCDASTYTSISGIDICPRCGYGSASVAAQTIRQQQAFEDYMRALTQATPDKSFNAGTWLLHIYYKCRGTKSEGEHGVLLHDGQPVEPHQVGELIETDLGTLKYYGHLDSMTASFEHTGWNFKDASRIRPSWVIQSEDQVKSAESKGRIG